MFDPAGECGGEGVRVGDPGSGASAPMWPLVLPEAVNAQVPLLEVQLRRVLQVGDAPHAGLFGHPAFVADMPVATAGIRRREDSACLRRCRVGYRQPGPRGPVLCQVTGCGVEVGRRKPCPFRVEPPQLRARCLERARFPSAIRPLPQFGIGLAPAARLVWRQGLRAVRRALGESQLTGRIGVFEVNRGGVSACILSVSGWRFGSTAGGCHVCRRRGRGAAGSLDCGSHRHGGPRAWRGGSGFRWRHS
jgi:hypothetical protein